VAALENAPLKLGDESAPAAALELGCRHGLSNLNDDLAKPWAAALAPLNVAPYDADGQDLRPRASREHLDSSVEGKHRLAVVACSFGKHEERPARVENRKGQSNRFHVARPASHGKRAKAPDERSKHGIPKKLFFGHERNDSGHRATDDGRIEQA
jgi:hypothetical protein